MKLALRSVVVSALALGSLSLGCSAIPVKMHTETHIQHADGTVEHSRATGRGLWISSPNSSGRPAPSWATSPRRWRRS